ncbi:MAG: 2-C-methyl-D-erythritol 4-phosphate cytidylyltransferase, partial [Muribaculaceae bacterium]|nr:2-C-methyl-D-erythritol 4-phosphate cytidylyltransferase [Muribaculaceae bacterium]
YDDIINIVVAGGNGSRFGGTLPKQFHCLDGMPVLMRSINRIDSALPGSHTVVVLGSGFLQLWHDLCRQYGFSSPVTVIGGATRWESVKNAIDATADIPARIITVHDGARPLVTHQTISRVIAGCDGRSGAIPVIPVTDSLRLVNDNRSEAVDRSAYRAVQTPQAFQAAKLRMAYRQPYSETFTDDASVMTAAGYHDMALVDGDPANIKITNPDDIDIAGIYLRRQG